MANYNFSFDIIGSNLGEQIGKFNQHLENSKTNPELISLDEYVDTVIFDKNTAVKELANFLINKYQDKPFNSKEEDNLLIKILIEDYISQKREVFYSAREAFSSISKNILLEESLNLIESDSIKNLVSKNKDLKTITENLKMLDRIFHYEFVKGLKLKEKNE